MVDKNKKDLWLLSINYGFFGDGIRTHNERVAKFAHELFGHGIVLRYLSDVQYLDLLDKKLRLRVASNAPVNINTVTDRRKDEKAIALLLKEEIDKGDFHLTEEEERMRLLILEAIAVSVENAVVNALDNNGKREKTIDFVRRMYSGNNLPFYEEAVKWSINNCNVDGLGGVYWFQLVDRVRVFGKEVVK